MSALRSAPATPPAEEGTEVLVRATGALGRLTLNRPGSINALTLEMVRQLQVGLDRFEADPAIRVVLLDGAGERGLCAGGDIVALHDSVKAGTDDSRIFWTEEYALDARIARFPKPVVSVLDGIVMGGGIGVAGHASHRLATERLLSAMPEVGIGFAPDVGGTWLYSRGDGQLGTHLALTGARLGARDAIVAGLADTVVASSAIPALIEALAAIGDGAQGSAGAIVDVPADVEEAVEVTIDVDHASAREAVDAAVAQAAQTPVDVPDGVLEDARAWIDEAYAHDSVEAIVAALQARPEPAAGKAAEQILRASPTSLKVTLRALREAAALPDLETALQHELRISCGFLRAGDFVEGVRAQVIDKDRQPQWRPATLQEVDDDTVASFFAPLGEHDLDLPRSS
ncbi:MAG: enoyl-CoA hydratase/isomerase family protein [Solirubrobacteraceae bacterium]|nr:enoyl-CoA hydratase/isomerase family protein [Solirubrobacteraceae bacterium]